MRPSLDQYFISIAEAVSQRGTCPKARVGSLLVKDNSIISTGYNGAPSGMPHCIDNGCVEIAGHCKSSVHSEHNAILQAAKHGNSTNGSVLYTTHFPCVDCLKFLKNAGVSTIRYKHPYKNNENFINLSQFDIQQII